MTPRFMSSVPYAPTPVVITQRSVTVPSAFLLAAILSSACYRKSFSAACAAGARAVRLNALQGAMPIFAIFASMGASLASAQRH